jgi:hypothetical protein
MVITNPETFHLFSGVPGNMRRFVVGMTPICVAVGAVPWNVLPCECANVSR